MLTEKEIKSLAEATGELISETIAPLRDRLDCLEALSEFEALETRLDKLRQRVDALEAKQRDRNA